MIFWIFALCDIKRTKTLPYKLPVPWTALSITKIVLCIILVLISIAELWSTAIQRRALFPIPDISLYSSSCKIVTYAMVLGLVLKHKFQRLQSSSLLCLFWFFQSIFAFILHRSSILKAFYSEMTDISMNKFILDMVQYPVVYSQFFLSVFRDKSFRKEKESYIEDEPFFSFISFAWMDSLIIESTRRLLTYDDFTMLSYRLRAKYLWDRFQAKLSKYWCGPMETDSADKEAKFFSLTKVLVCALWPVISLYVILEVINSVFQYSQPLILDLLIQFVLNDVYQWRGYFYCGLLFVANLFSRMIYNIFYFHATFSLLQIKSTLTTAIYRKSLRISSATRRNYTSGELVNLMSVDVDKISNFVLFSTMLFGCPLKMFLSMTLLWAHLGWSCFSALVVIAVLVSMTLILAKLNSALQVKQMSTKDSRLKHMNEVLNGIKVLKLCAWEIPFMNKINSVRLKEVKLIRKFLFLYAASSFIWGCAPFLLAIACFVTFVTVDEKHILDASIVFVSLNILNTLKFSLFALPDVISDLVQTNVSLRRIRLFLQSEEYDVNAVGEMTDKGESITMREASLSWEKEGVPVVQNATLHIPKGALVAVIGPVGSGKSSLLSAILGDMYRVTGSVDLKGSVAYVPQQSWVLNETLQQNVLFVKPMDKEKYNRVIQACCLKADLKQLPGGDQTEIGEKGVNMSGGQKQRVSLARAVYQDMDIYLLDDPLSAVDVHVGKELFENVIGNKGLLRKKTRVLVTHSISVLPYVDLIISMKDGKIVESGKYEDLINQNGSFSEFMRLHAEQEAEGSKEEGTEGDHHEKISSVLERSGSIQSPLLFRTISVHSIKDGEFSKLVEDERMEIGGVKRQVYISYLKRAGFFVLLPSVFCYMCYQAFEIGGNLWLTEWSNDGSLPDGTQDIALRNKRIIVYAALGLSQAISVVSGNLLLAIGVARASSRYHRDMLMSVMRSPMSFFDTTPLGRVMNRFGKDMDVIDCELPFQIDGFLVCLFAVVGTFIVIGMSTPVFLLFSIPVGILYYVLQKLYLISSRQIKRLESVSRSPIFSHFQQTVQGISTIRAYKVQEEFIERAQFKIDRNISCYFQWCSCNRWLGVRLDIIGSVIVLIASLLGISNVDLLDAAVVGLTLTYALSITDSLTWLVRTGTELENKCVSVERIEDYSHLRPEAPWNITSRDPPKSWPENGNIKFYEYGTCYREGLPLVLQKLNLEIMPNEKVGIIGRTGAGKSSITLALFRIIEPFEGSIIIDDVNVAQLGLHTLRSKLTIIPQDPVLFTGPLRMNLDPSATYTDDAMWTSLERAHLKEFVASLASGLNHDIAEGGENLSVGQRQLVCLARALLKKSKILILDEATAAVDVNTDALIQRTIRTEFANHTVITIAHRLNTVMDYDKIVVMDSGQIVEVGSPQDLLKNPESKFYTMAKDAGLA